MAENNNFENYTAPASQVGRLVIRFSCVNGEWQDGIGNPIPIFPLQCGRDKCLPRVVAEEAYKEYSEKFGMSQSLDRLGERGGFGSAEIAILLFDRIKRIESNVGV